MIKETKIPASAEEVRTHMQIGEVIRKYRRANNLTQERMANSLGVTAPAVNKWESGSTMPDILMLAPIARLLNISLDELLSYHENLTTQEIDNIVTKAAHKLKNESYENAFRWAKGKTEQYPNCEALIWQIAAIFDSARFEYDIAETKRYDDFIFGCYLRVLNSADENLRNNVADSLFHFYINKKQYDKAEEYLDYLSHQNPERKRKQALIFSKTNQKGDAYRTYEELLYSGYQMLNKVFNGIYLLAMEEGNIEKARYIVDKQETLAGLFEMGKYHEVASVLDLVTSQRDQEATIETMENMLASINTICNFSRSELYEHMRFKDISETYVSELRKNLMNCFKNEDIYDYLKEEQRWQRLTASDKAE